MKRLFTLSMLALMAVMTVTAQAYRKWDFTNWSATTVANLKADSNWSDIEKAGATEPTDISKDNCFWEVQHQGTADGVGIMANDTPIAELEGLLYTNTTDRSLAIAVNYGDCTPTNGEGFGPYHGPSYLWFGGKTKNYFVIPKVAPGTTIKIGVESHKITDARGLKLYVGHGTSGTQLLSPDGSSVDVPKEYTEQEWLVPDNLEDIPNDDGTYDIQIQNTNGCHLYFIEVGDANEKSKAAYLYNGSLDADAAYTYLTGNEQFTVDPIEANGNFSADDLMAYDALIVSSTVDNAYTLNLLKSIQPFVPMLNLNPALCELFSGYSATADGHMFAIVSNPSHALFRGIELIENPENDNKKEVLPLTMTKPCPGVTLGEYFANDLVLATMMESGSVAIHGHNLNHNGYLFIPYTQETIADAASPQLLANAVSVLVNSKAKVTQTPKPSFTLGYKHQNTNVSIKCSISGAQIFYTLDGSTPTEESTRYTEPFNIATAGVTVKAVALGDGYTLSEVAEQAVDLKNQLAPPVIATTEEAGRTIVTLTTDLVGTDYAIYYNYDGNNAESNSSLYDPENPIVITAAKRTLYAFVTAEGWVSSELASKTIAVNNPKVRIDVLAHMDANAAEYNNGSNSTAYYFSWGKSKTTYNYYNVEAGYTEQTIIDENGDEQIVIVYNEMNPEEEVDFGNGWMVRSRGQVVDWENLTTGNLIGDKNSYNYATVDDISEYFPATKCIVNLAEKNTVPADATFPYNAYIVTTQKFKGPFDIVINVGSIIKPENEAKHKVVLQTATDANNWEANWQTVGDTITIKDRQRLTSNITRSYEGTDEVYVRAYLCADNSKTGFYDIYIANEGEKSRELLAGISEKTVTGETRVAAVYSLNGVRLDGMRPGINIVRYSDGTARKVIKK